MTRTKRGRVLQLNLVLAVLLATLLLAVQPTDSQIESANLDSDATIVIDHHARIEHSRELLGARGSRTLRAESGAVAASMETFIEDYIRGALPKPYRRKTSRIAKAVIREAARQNLDPLFVMSVISHESHFNPDAVGGAGEIGLMQIKPSTAEWIAKRDHLPWTGAQSLFDPEVNIRLATCYIAHLRGSFAGLPTAYVSAYNMGPLNVRRHLESETVPSMYTEVIMGKYHRFYRRLIEQVEGPREFTVSMHQTQNGQILGRISN